MKKGASQKQRRPRSEAPMESKAPPMGRSLHAQPAHIYAKVEPLTNTNRTHLGAHQVAALRSALAASLTVSSAPEQEYVHSSRSLPLCHVSAVLGCLRNLHLDAILDPLPSCQRD